MITKSIGVTVCGYGDQTSHEPAHARRLEVGLTGRCDQIGRGHAHVFACDLARDHQSDRVSVRLGVRVEVRLIHVSKIGEGDRVTTISPRDSAQREHGARVGR